MNSLWQRMLHTCQGLLYMGPADAPTYTLLEQTVLPSLHTQSPLMSVPASAQNSL